MGLYELIAPLHCNLKRADRTRAVHFPPAGAELLSAYSSIEEVIRALNDTRFETFALRDELLRDLLTEYRHATSGASRSIWGSALIVAFTPMLLTVRREIWSRAIAPDDLDHLVLEGFFDALERCPLEARIVCRRIRLDARRFVFRVVTAEHRQLVAREKLADEAKRDLGFVLFEWRGEPAPLDEDERVEVEELLRALVGDSVPEPRLATVIRTRIWNQPLTDSASSRTSAKKLGSNARARTAETDAARRDYERLKRQRTRTLTRLREILAERLSPPDPQLALDLSRLRAAS